MRSTSRSWRCSTRAQCWRSRWDERRRPLGGKRSAILNASAKSSSASRWEMTGRCRRLICWPCIGGYSLPPESLKRPTAGPWSLKTTELDATAGFGISLQAAMRTLPPGLLTRFAPAPAGHLHLGHVANALVVWGVARATACQGRRRDIRPRAARDGRKSRDAASPRRNGDRAPCGRALTQRFEAAEGEALRVKISHDGLSSRIARASISQA